MSDTSWDSLRTGRVAVPEHVVHRALAEETVLLNVRTSTYHVVDEVGSRFFQTILAASSLEAACAELAAEYEQPSERIAADLTTFCRELQELGLIDVRTGR
jgi:Coenzyme PQQ synthesis protein D (PqqD)